MRGPPPLSAFSPRERALVRRLDAPVKVQRWLDGLPYNWERRGETLRTLRGVLRRGRAHCAEAALCAATVLEQHGYPPLLLDLESVDHLDHVLFVFQHRGRFGSIARSRDPGLHGRKPHYRNLHSLVQSYAAPYVDATGRLKGYGLLDLRTLPARVDWRLGEGDVLAVEDALIGNRHRGFRTSDAFHARWHRKYLAFREAHPRGRPSYYPNRHHWL